MTTRTFTPAEAHRGGLAAWSAQAEAADRRYAAMRRPLSVGVLPASVASAVQADVRAVRALLWMSKWRIA